MKKLSTMGLALAGTLAFTSPAHAFLFDGFGDDQGPVTDETAGDGGESSTPMAITDTDLVGAERTLEANLTGESGASGDISTEVIDSFFSHTQSSGEEGYTNVSYTFDATSFGDPLNLALNVTNNDQGGSIDFTLEDAVGGTDTQTIALSEDETGNFLFSFSGMDVDLSQVNAANLQVWGNASLDLEADFIEVPAPGVLGLLGIGLAGIAFVARRRRDTDVAAV